MAFELFVESFIFNRPAFSEIYEHIGYFISLALIGLLAEILLRTVMAKSFAVELLEIKHELGAQLEMAPDWNKLADLILAFCEAVGDPERVVLLINTESGSFEVAAQSQSKKYQEAHKGAGTSTNGYCICTEGVAKNLHAIKLSSGSVDEIVSPGYCLPLILGWRIIAINV